MRISAKIYFVTGLFVVLVLISISYTSTILGINKVGENKQTYTLSATFNNIGSLKDGASVRIGGVQIGRVSKISLNNEYQPEVFIKIAKQYDKIPSSSIISIKTNGILGDKYLDIQLGFDDGSGDFLVNGSQFTTTNGAIILEDLIGKFLYSQ